MLAQMLVKYRFHSQEKSMNIDIKEITLVLTLLSLHPELSSGYV